MKTKLTLIFALFLTVAFSSNLTAQVKSDYDKNADFTKYKTYSFLGWQKESDQQLNEFDKKRIYDSFKSEFSARGMEYVETGGDVSITFFIVVNAKTSTTAYTNYTGGYGYSGRWGWGMGPGGYATTTYSESDYNEGTFVIDLYDNDTKSLVWQGILTKVVNEKPEKREKTIPKSVKKLMKKYPVKPVKK